MEVSTEPVDSGDDVPDDLPSSSWNNPIHVKIIKFITNIKKNPTITSGS